MAQVKKEQVKKTNDAELVITDLGIVHKYRVLLDDEYYEVERGFSDLEGEFVNVFDEDGNYVEDEELFDKLVDAIDKFVSDLLE